MLDTVKGNPNCTDCVLHRTAQFVCLMGQGRIPSKVMIVGEAPGTREDEVGKPFQGRSGKLLDQMLEEIDLDRERVYITNAVKCRPPENRAPKGPEMKACRSYLERELEEVRPKYVVLLGAAALKQVLKKAKITELHGTPIVEGKTTYYPIYHPAAALRNPKLMGPMRQDWRKLRDILDGKDTSGKKIDFKLIEDESQIEELCEAIRESSRVSFDCETEGLDYHDEGLRVNTLGITCGNGSDVTGTWVLPLGHMRSPFRRKLFLQREMVQAIAKACREGIRPKMVVANNGKFDNNWLKTKFDATLPLSFDNMLAFHLIDENQPTGLKYLAVAHCGAPNYDIPLDVKTGRKHDPESTKLLHRYQAADTFYTYQLPDVAIPKLKADDALYPLFKRLVMPTARVYEQIERNGVYVHRNKLEEYGIELEETREDKLIELNDIVRKKTGWYRNPNLCKRTKSNPDGHVNWNSPKQINHILFDELELEPRGFTPGGDPSTNEVLLNLMKDDHPIIKTLLEYREVQKMKSTYVDGWLSRMHGNYLYPTFKTNGTITGRPSCEDPNLQATTRNKRLRSCVGAPPGWIFFEADYSQVELRVAAMLSGDEEMCRIFQTGGDIHRTTASLISGVPEDEVSDEDRKKAKAVNFGFLYGMGWKKFMDYARDKYGVIVTERQAKEFRRRFFERYAGLPPWHDRQRRIVAATSRARTLTGRIRHLEDINSDDKGVAAKAERDSINAPVQGFAAEMTLMASIEIAKRTDLDTLRLCGTVHDAIIGRVREDVAEETMAMVKEIMEHPPLLDYFGIDLTVPIISEVKLGDWGIGKKLF